MNILHPLWAEIDLDSVEYNINKIKVRAKDSEIIGVVKANAYGHGAVEISKILIENGVRRLAVANIMEALELRKNGISCSLMILGISSEEALEEIVKGDIEVAVSSYSFAYKLSEIAKKLGKKAKIHIALDTGMGRIGFKPSEKSIEDIKNIINRSNLEIVSMFSHFATADSEDKEYCKFQRERYHWFYNELSKHNLDLIKKNISNSAALIDIPDFNYDYVRPGIIQYGYYPSKEVKKDFLNIKPVLTWKTKIIHIKTVNKGEFIGYGMSFETKRKTVVATIPVGYGDGYSRRLSGRGKVIINGQLAPVIGNICMDQSMIDITDIEGVELYSEVILMGAEGDVKFDADDMASILDTINYEVLCSIGRRVERVYLRNKKVVSIQDYI